MADKKQKSQAQKIAAKSGNKAAKSSAPGKTATKPATTEKTKIPPRLISSLIFNCICSA